MARARSMLAYGQSKTANVLFAVEAASRWASDGITANAVHPGAVIETNLACNLDPDILAAAIETAGYSISIYSFYLLA